MARNTDLNAYVEVGIPRHSATYQRLAQDAKDKGVTVAKLIAMRIDDFYKYGSQPTLAGADLHVVPPPTDTDEVIPPPVEMDQEEVNALAALDAWG